MEEETRIDSSSPKRQKSTLQTMWLEASEFQLRTTMTYISTRIEKERQNKSSSNVVTPAKANDYDDVYFDEVSGIRMMMEVIITVTEDTKGKSHQ